MEQNTFVYTTFIAAAPEKVWEALTKPEFTKIFWFGREVHSDWKQGSEVTYTMPDGNCNIRSKILAIDPPKFMEFTFKDVSTAALADAPETIVTYQLEQTKASGTKLTVTHHAKVESLFKAISGGWTMILSGLKTLLETGKPMAV